MHFYGDDESSIIFFILIRSFANHVNSFMDLQTITNKQKTKGGFQTICPDMRGMQDG